MGNNKENIDSEKGIENTTVTTTNHVITQTHQLNQVGTPAVDDFLNAFDQNKIGTCLQLIQSGDIIIVDKNSLLGKMEELQRYKDNNKNLEAALAESYKDLGVVVDTTLKLNSIYDPIRQDLKPIFDKAGIDEGKELSKGQWGKILFKLVPILMKTQKRVGKIMKTINLDGVQEIFKFGDESTTEQDLFDEDYLAKIDKIKLPNTKIKLLQKLLAKIIGEIKKVNKVKGIDFTKKMESLVARYNEREENDVLRGEVY